MRIMGYSERGILSSLFYEIAPQKGGSEALNALWAIVRPFDRERKKVDIDFNRYQTTIFMEPALSDFGNPDVILLLDPDEGTGESGKIIFIEAKVAKEGRFEIEDELNIFNKGWKIKEEHSRKNSEEYYLENGEEDYPKGFTSNLFTQLYHKYAFFTELKNLKEEENIENFSTGKNVFPKKYEKSDKKKSEWRGRSIGKNRTVIKVVKDIKRTIGADGEAIYVAIVPDKYPRKKVPRKKNDNGSNKDFIEKIMPQVWEENGSGYFKIFRERGGIIYWEDIYEEICPREASSGSLANLVRTKEVFEYNGKQIFLKENGSDKI